MEKSGKTILQIVSSNDRSKTILQIVSSNSTEVKQFCKLFLQQHRSKTILQTVSSTAQK